MTARCGPSMAGTNAASAIVTTMCRGKTARRRAIPRVPLHASRKGPLLAVALFQLQFDLGGVEHGPVVVLRGPFQQRFYARLDPSVEDFAAVGGHDHRLA